MKHYAGQSTAELFGAETLLYVIPKSNATIRGCYAWKDMIRDFMFYPFLFLQEYFKREHSESGFSADKRFNGWKIWERRDDRIQTTTMCKGVWHNLILARRLTTDLYPKVGQRFDYLVKRNNIPKNFVDSRFFYG